MSLIGVVLWPLLAGVGLAWWLGQRSRLGAALGAGLAVLASLTVLWGHVPAVWAGESVLQSWAWVPSIGLNVSLRLDGLSLLFSGLVLVIGLLVVVYAHHYLGPDDSPAQFYALLMLFMAAMLGVVLSDNLLLLVVFWELTSLSSFLLVGFWGHRADARAGARQALAVTGGGGLALMAGALLLGQAGGSLEISVLATRAAEVQASPLFLPALLLVLLGAFTKSAQFPFHFWLPDAMAAPTPVSAYLHSATMVKAGVFLLMRLTPVLAGSAAFETLVVGAGLVTLLLGAALAVFKHDLKGLLAYSTISHLGLLTLLIGLGSPLAAVAAVFHVLNHALFKAALFMVAGIVDHETHSRDMRLLGGLAGAMPWLATLAVLASAAMAGVPLTNGFISKEMAFAEVVAHADGGWLLPVAVTLGGVFSVAYSARFVHDTFFNGPLGAVPNRQPHDAPWGLRLPVLVLVSAALVVGLLPQWVAGPLVMRAATAMAGQPLPEVVLSQWHGFNTALLMSAVALVGGGWLYLRLAAGRRLHGLQSEAWFGPATGRQVFERGMAMLWSTARGVTGVTANGSLQRQVALVLGLAAGLALVAVWPVVGGPAGTWTGPRPGLPATPLALVLWCMTAAACVALLALHRHRLVAVLLVGVVGLVTSLTFLGLSAPDLALTQLSVEVVSTVMLLMGLALLPAWSPVESSSARRWRDGALAIGCGTGVAALAWWFLTRDHNSLSWYFLEQSLPKGGGTNVVNVILVDFRGYDTLGEITVLGIAAVGVLALMDGFRVRRSAVDPQGRLWTFAASPLLLRVAASAVLPLALVVSVYLFMRGHNEPGGGFIAGLVTAVALVLQFMSMGQAPVEAVLRARGGQRMVRWIAMGLGVALATGLGAWWWGRPLLTSAFGHPVVPVLGELPLATAALFDLGVYLTVVGSTLLALSVLGSVSRPVPGPAPKEVA